MAQSDLQKTMDALLSVAGEISGNLTNIVRLLEEQQDGQTQRSGNAPQAPGAASSGGAAKDGKSKEEKEAEKRAKQLAAERLNIGLDTIVGLSDPTQSKILAAAEGAKRFASFAVGAAAEKVGGTAGKEFAQASLEATLNLSGVNQQINTLKQAQGSLMSRVVGASDAGLIYSDQQLQEIAASEIGRFEERAKQINRSRAAFDAELTRRGLSKIGVGSDDERNQILKDIRQELKNQNQAKSLKGGNQ